MIGLGGQRPRASGGNRGRLCRSSYRWFCWAAMLLGFWELGCGSPTLHNREFHDGQFDFRVGPVPRSWRPIEQFDSLVAFRDDRLRATVAVGGRCGKDGDDVPLAALTQHLFLYFTRQEVLRKERFHLDGREALRTELAAELDGVPMHFTVVVLKKNGCVYDFVYIEEAAGNPEGRQAFDQFVSEFRTLGAS